MDPWRTSGWVAAMLVILAWGFGTVGQDQQTPERKAQEDEVRMWDELEALSIKVKEALDKSEEALAHIERLRARGKLPPEVAVPAAQAAFLLGYPSEALAIVERVVREYPNEKYHSAYPLRIMGNFLIGRLARYAGDPTRAEAAYREVLSQLKKEPDIDPENALVELCYLYLAEIEGHVRNRSEKAVALLEEVQRLPPPKDDPRMGPVGKEWAQHMKRTFSPSTTPPGTPTYFVLNQPEDIMAPMLYIITIGFGLFGDLGLEWRPDPLVFVLEKIIRSKVSPIDMSLAQGTLAFAYMKDKDYAKARRYAEDLFKGDSFWAPVGGIIWACSLKEMGKPQEAEAVLQEVIRRFPANKEIVLRLQKEWAAESKQKQKQ